MTMNLLSKESQRLIIPLSYAKKLQIDGISKDYPVYKIPITELFYNDQNDRIATWISQYRTENISPFKYDTEEDRKIFNDIIEQFIIDSNKDRLNVTMNNIKLIGQREPGVVLRDGRIIDGNRRFTCLRILSNEDYNLGYFEAVILDKDIEFDKKQIKLLELALQHGTDAIVDYDPIDKLVGLYKDVEEQKLLTINEYCQSTNEKLKEVERKLKEAKLMVEFLEFIKAPKQYHIARKLAIDGPLLEILMILEKEPDEEKQNDLKTCLFSMLLAKPSGDITRYIREVKKLVGTDYLDAFINEQKGNAYELHRTLPEDQVTTIEYINENVRSNDDLKAKMKGALDKYTYQNDISTARNKPLTLLNKCIDTLSLVDHDFFPKMKDDEKKNISESLENLKGILEEIESALNVSRT